MQQMLDITMSQTMTEEKWTLSGSLVWPWVNELRANWMRTHRGVGRRSCIVVLNDLNLIDESGERILRSMYYEGAQLVTTNLGKKQLLERLNSITQGVQPWAHK